jgi:hypothetical protein
VRQPEIVRLLSLLLAVLLVAPVARTAGDLALSAAFLVEFLSDGAWRPLSSLTGTPHREPMSVPGVAVDRWIGPAIVHVPLVLVHGYSPEGKDDSRVRQAAALLARAGFDVAVPTIPGLTRGRLRPDDIAPVVATLAARAAPTVMISVSVGAGPALLAAAQPEVRDRVRVVLSLGGYASAAELLRFFLTGDFRWGSIQGHVDHDPAIVRQFVEANADLLDAPAREILADPVRAVSVLDHPPARLASVLDQLSPETPRCPTRRASAWRRRAPNGPPSFWWASWPTSRPPGARRGCRACGRWVPCSWGSTACLGPPEGSSSARMILDRGQGVERIVRRQTPAQYVA